MSKSSLFLSLILTAALSTNAFADTTDAGDSAEASQVSQDVTEGAAEAAAAEPGIFELGNLKAPAAEVAAAAVAAGPVVRNKKNSRIARTALVTTALLLAAATPFAIQEYNTPQGKPTMFRNAVKYIDNIGRTKAQKAPAKSGKPALSTKLNKLSPKSANQKAPARSTVKSRTAAKVKSFKLGRSKGKSRK